MANVDETWFDYCQYAEEPYDDFECVITPHDMDDYFDGWKSVLADDFSFFMLKAYCTRWEDEELYSHGFLYDCWVTLNEDGVTPNTSYDLAHFHAHDEEEALRLLIAAANALDF